MTLTLQRALSNPPWKDQPRPATPEGRLARARLAVARGPLPAAEQAMTVPSEAATIRIAA